jgi:MFS family permease
MFLIVPFGTLGGYLGVTVAYLLKQHGITVAEVAQLLALALLPHTWKFLWAPVADTTWSRKGWYLVGAVTTAAGVLLTSALDPTRANMPLLRIIVLTSNIGCTFLGMSTESLMAYETREDEKGRAGGWFQAGNLGGAGVGGGLGLFLAQRLHAEWMSGAIVGALCLACALALFFVPEPEASHRHQRLGANLAFVVRDLWATAKSRAGLLALILCFLPIGSGAAGGLFAAVAGDWKASADTVALVGGVLGGVISALGCVVGGWLADRMDRKNAYMLYGALQAACAVGMALAPRTEWMFIVWTSAYAFITGLTYAGFTAFVLEAMGLGAAATKYSLYASLSNMPIAYMTVVDGWAQTKWNSAMMLYVESALCLAGLVAFVGVMAIAKRIKITPLPAAAPIE